MDERDDPDRPAPLERLERHYRHFDEGARLRRSRVRRLEFETTVALVGRRMRKRGTLLDLGTGHGAYAVHFAQLGHRVLAADVLASNAEAAREVVRHAALDQVEVRVMDATRLDELAAGSFDTVLCLGPYYHLRITESRLRCLQGCRRVVNDAGVVALSYVNRSAAIAFLLHTGRALRREQYASLMSPDNDRTDYPDDFFNVTHFSTPREVEAEVQSCGFDVLDHVGTDGPFGFLPEPIEQLAESEFDDYRNYHFASCDEPCSGPAASAHGLVVLRPAR